MKQDRDDMDKRLDDLFKSKLEDPLQEPAFRKEDWGAMEAMLDEKKKRPAIIYWLPILSTVAAVALIFLVMWLSKPDQVATTKQDNKLAADQHSKKQKTDAIPNSGSNKSDTGVGSNATNQQIAATGTQHSVDTVNKVQHLIAGTNSGRRNPVFTSPVIGGHRDVTGKNTPVTNGVGANGNNGLNGNNNAIVVNPENLAMNNHPAEQHPEKGNEVIANNNAGRDTGAAQGDSVTKPAENTIADNQTKPDKNAQWQDDLKPAKAKVKGVGNGYGYKPQLAISAQASSDFNGVNSAFAQTKVGSNFGMMLSVGVTRKLTISTGGIYSMKPYTENFSDYHTQHQFYTDPQKVNADCRMIDIPLNVDYQVYHRHNNKISVGTGLSSYLMTSENYAFSYADGETGPANYKVPHSGKYFFGVANLEATYQHQVNSRFGVTLQPYMKIPLANVGYSQVKLQSTGLAVGVAYNISSSAK